MWSAGHSDVASTRGGGWAVTALSPHVWARHRTDAPQSHGNHVVRCPSAVNSWTPHAGTQRHLTCPSEDTGHSPQSGSGAGKPEPPRGLHSAQTPLLSSGAGPDHDRTAGAGGLVGAGIPQTQWWAVGSAPAAVGLDPPPPSLWGNLPGQRGSHSSRPARRSLPCCQAKALFVCPGPSKALLSPIHALPGWHVDARPDGQPRDWPPEHAALSGHRGTRRHQCESLELGVGGEG